MSGRWPTQATTQVVPISAGPAPVDPVLALRLAIQNQVSTGHLNPDAARDLNSKVDDIARQIGKGDNEEANKKIKELRDRLAGFLRDGRLTPQGYAEITAALDVLAGTIT